MSATAEDARAASVRRMAVGALAAFIGLLLIASVALWVTLGSAVFFEVLAAGIAYCF
jgi:hypothetical protein